MPLKCSHDMQDLQTFRRMQDRDMHHSTYGSETTMCNTADFPC